MATCGCATARAARWVCISDDAVMATATQRSSSATRIVPVSRSRITRTFRRSRIDRIAVIV
jgi:hypothetical protein